MTLRNKPSVRLTRACNRRYARLLVCGGVIPWRAQNWPIGCCAHPAANAHSCVMEVIARLLDQALCAEVRGSGIPGPVAEPAAGVGISRVQAGLGRRLVPSAAFLNTDATSPASAQPVSAWSSASAS